NLTHHGVGLEVMMLSNIGAARAMSLTAALLPLTTVRAPFYQLGWRAVELLLQRLGGQPVPDVVTIPTELVVRRSCGCFSSAGRVHSRLCAGTSQRRTRSPTRRPKSRTSGSASTR